MIGQCETCVFWAEGNTLMQHRRACKRYAPIAVMQMLGTTTPRVNAEWPMTSKDDGCGEHKLKKPEKKLLNCVSESFFSEGRQLRCVEQCLGCAVMQERGFKPQT